MLEKQKAILEGTFIQPSYIKGWSESDYNRHLRSYRELGFNHVILQWVEYKNMADGKRYAYYPCSLPERKIEQDLLTNLLRYGAEHNIKVYIGLNINDEWWRIIFKTPSKLNQWMLEETNTSIELVDDIWRRYVNSEMLKAIAGWYLPHEVDNLNFNTIEKQNIIAKHYNIINSHIKRITKLPIMISPFFNIILKPIFGPEKWCKMWFSILSQTEIDILALQDGVGCLRELPIFEDLERKNAIQTVGEWFDATRKAIKKSGSRTVLWSDLETFTEGFEDGERIFRAAPIERIIRQIEAEKTYVKKITSFSFQAYQDYDRNKQLFDEYKDYLGIQ